jgi:hypothetical protein
MSTKGKNFVTRGAAVGKAAAKEASAATGGAAVTWLDAAADMPQHSHAAYANPSVFPGIFTSTD